MLFIVLSGVFFFDKHSGAVVSYADTLKDKSIKGEVTCEPFFQRLDGKEEVLLLPSSTGLYLVKNGKIIQHLLPGKFIHATGMIPDQDRDGEADIVATVRDSLLPNVVGVSSRTGKTLWMFSPDSKAYREGLGWVNYQPEEVNLIRAYQKETFSQEEYLYLTADNMVYKLRVKDGTVLWSYTERYPIDSSTRISDIDGDSSAELCIGTRGGEMVAISSNTGQEIWRKKITRYAGERGPQLYHSGGTIWVVHRGTVSLYRSSDGTVIWERVVTKQTQDSLNDLKLHFIGNINGDEQLDAILTSYTQQKFLALNGTNGETVWERGITVPQDNLVTYINDIGGKTSLFLLSPSYSKVQRINGIDITNGRELKDGIITLEYVEADSDHPCYAVADSSGRVLFTGFSSEISLYDREFVNKAWSLNSFKHAGYLMIDKQAGSVLLLFSLNNGEEGERKTGLIQKATHHENILWEYQLDSYMSANYSGLERIQTCGDLDQDGEKDIIGALSVKGTLGLNSLPSRVIAISGKTGKMLWQSNLILGGTITSLFALPDVNQDQSPEIMAATSTQYYVLDGAEGKITRNWAHQSIKDKHYFEPTKGLTKGVVLLPTGDINKDGLNDIFVVAPDEVRLGLTNKVEGLDFYYKEHHRISQGQYELAKTQTFEDLDNDGIPELMLTKKAESEHTEYLIMSGANGRILLKMTGSSPIFVPTGVDYNHNGYNDVMVYEETGVSLIQLRILDGAGGDVLWSYAGFTKANTHEINSSLDSIPACVLEDLNADSIPELAIVKSSESGNGMVIEIFDIAGGYQEPYRTTTLQQPTNILNNRQWVPAYIAKKIFIAEKSHLAVAPSSANQAAAGLVIFDYNKNIPVAIYPGNVHHFDINHQMVVVEEQGGKISVLNSPRENPDITVTYLEESISPVSIEWKKKSAIKTFIYVDNAPIQMTSGDQTELNLTQGEHIIGIAQYDAKGDYTYSNFSVNITKHSYIKEVTYIFTIILLSILFGLPLIFKQRIRAGGRNV